MKAILINRALCLALILAGLIVAVADDPAKSGKPTESLVAVTTTEKKTVVGELAEQKEGAKNLVIQDVVTGKDVELTAKQIVGKPQTVTDEEAIKLSKNPGAVVAWRIAQKIVQGIPKGKVASVNGGIIFTTMGAKDRLRPGSELLVYRGEEVIKDPDSGEVIGKQRRLVAKLDVVSVEEKSSKVRLKGDLEITLNVGDQVELPSAEPAIAVLPATDSEGNAFEGTVKIANEIVSQLVRRKVKVVERRKFTDALTELAIQQTELFDAATAAKLGKLAGASHVVTGNVTRPGNSGFKAELSLRLVRVETSDIVSATNFESYPFRFDPVNDNNGSEVAIPRAKINVLKELKDVNRATRKGSWELRDGTLRNLADHSVVSLPVEIKSGSYEISMELNRAAGTEAIFVWLPVGDRDVRLQAGDFHGLEAVSGQAIAQSPTRSPGKFENGRWHRLVANVTVKGADCKIRVTLDGNSIVNWNGKVADLSGGTDWAPSNKSQLGIAALKGRLSFRDIQFSGSGKVVR